MSLCILNSRAREGIRAPAVTVEGHLADDLTALSIVGLPEPAVRESKDRGRGALLNSHFRFPTGRVTINLAPADLPKEGGRFDLPIAVGVLGASGQLKCDLLDRLEVHGELAFSGSLCPVTGILLAALAALAARDAGRALILPRENADEAAFVKGLTIYPADHFLQVCEHIKGTALLPPFEHPKSGGPIRGHLSGLGRGPRSGVGKAHPGDRRGRCSQSPVAGTSGDR